MINPALLTAAEKLQYDGYLRREETNGAILTMAEEGVTIKEIVRRTGPHPKGGLYSPLEPFFTKEWRPSEIELVHKFAWGACVRLTRS
jgi:hypothetical protein